MTQASLQLQQLVSRIWHQGDALLNSRSFKRYSRKVEASKGWLLGLVILMLLWLWNWQLVLSGSMGLAAWLLVYLGQQGQWRLPQINWQAFWKPTNRALMLSCTSGAIVCFSTYFTLAIWQESGGSWLGKGIILEGFGLLAIVLLLFWQRIELSLGTAVNRDRRADLSRDWGFEHWLHDLSDPDALKRLIAVQRLTQWAVLDSASRANQGSSHSKGVSSDQIHPSCSLPPLPPSELAACFRLMLDRETEPAICRTLVNSPQTLNQQQLRSSRSLEPGSTLSVQTLGLERIKDEG